MSVFLESAATEQERARMLEHLAHCAACREMVFLAQGAETELRPAAALEEPRRTRWWTGRWMPVGLAGAALAFLVALVIYMRQPVAPVGGGQVATVQRPETPVNEPHPPAVQGGDAGRSSDRLGAPARVAPRGVASGSGGGMGAGIYQAAPAAPSPAVSMNEQVMQDARGNSLRVPENTTAAALAGQAVAKLHGVRVPQQQAVPAPQAPQGGPTAAQSCSSGPMAGQNVAALQILHDQGTSEGMSEVRGVVTDASGAAIARATVSLRSATDQAVREVATAEDGRFRIADVIAGRYELRVTARGFMTASEPLELKSRDVAMLEPVLRVGSESQTVTVEAGNAPMETSQAEVSGAISALEEKLPGGVAGVAHASIGDRMLAVDAAGHLYLSRNAGKSWKKIKPNWTGKAAQVAVAQRAEKDATGTVDTVKGKAAGNRQVFELTTDAGAVWTSEDGKHWRARADGHR
jgi:Carboxypeptidase regulatory-like domain